MLSKMNISKQVAIISSIILIAFLAGACGPIIPEQGSSATTTSSPTLTPFPSTVTPTSTPDVVFVTDVPTVLPTPQPPPILTPDAIHVERWQEYQTELAKALLGFDPDRPEGFDPDAHKGALCEWDILGQSGRELYVWVDCDSVNGLLHHGDPTVVYLASDGSIREVNVVRARVDPRTQLAVYDLHLFPTSVQETLCLYYFFGWVPQCSSIVSDYIPANGLSARERVLISHLDYRKVRAEVPPMVILSTGITVMPPQMSIPILTPNAIQVEKWKEYQAELAKVILARHRSNDGNSADPYQDALCEWEILGRSNRNIYVWALCAMDGDNRHAPAVIHLEADESIQTIESPSNDFKWEIEIKTMVTADVREQYILYAVDPRFPERMQEMLDHIFYRIEHPEELPLVVLAAEQR